MKSALTKTACRIPTQLARSLTRDRGKELSRARHVRDRHNLPNLLRRPAQPLATKTATGYYASTSRKARTSHPGPPKTELPDRVAADSIVNRLANNARIINLGQIDMRRHRNDQARAHEAYWE